MTVTLNTGDPQVRAGTFSDVETLTMSTATARQRKLDETVGSRIKPGEPV